MAVSTKMCCIVESQPVLVSAIGSGVVPVMVALILAVITRVIARIRFVDVLNQGRRLTLLSLIDRVIVRKKTNKINGLSLV